MKAHDGLFVLGDFGLAKDMDEIFDASDSPTSPVIRTTSQHTSGLGTASYAACVLYTQVLI